MVDPLGRLKYIRTYIHIEYGIHSNIFGHPQVARKGFQISSKENPFPNEGLTNIAEFTYETVQKT